MAPLKIRYLQAATYLYPIGSIPAHAAASRAHQALSVGNWQLAEAEAANAENLAKRAVSIAGVISLFGFLIPSAQLPSPSPCRMADNSGLAHPGGLLQCAVPSTTWAGEACQEPWPAIA